MGNLTEIVCPECGKSLRVYWDSSVSTPVIACDECDYLTSFENKSISNAFYEQFYNKIKYKEDLEKEIKLRHG